MKIHGKKPAVFFRNRCCNGKPLSVRLSTGLGVH
jgi:hypothetical protein